MKTRILPADQIDKERWNRLVETSHEGQVYHLFDYIDLLLSSGWSAIIVEEGNRYTGALPFFYKRKYGISYFIHPPFCQYWGILTDINKSGVANYYEQNKKIVSVILDSLPRNVRYWHIWFSPAFKYPLPLHWRGWELTPRYTYQVDLQKSEKEIMSNFASHARREINKAETSGIEVVMEDDAETAMTIFREEKPHLINKHISGYLNNLEKIAASLPTANAFCMTARLNHEPIASILYFKYKKVLIYFFGTVRSEHKNSGAMSAIIWNSITQNRDCSTLDFDGSMIENIERFFRGFGAEPVMFLEGKYSTIPFLTGIRRIWTK